MIMTHQWQTAYYVTNFNFKIPASTNVKKEKSRSPYHTLFAVSIVC